jgi:hypothetical protein
MLFINTEISPSIQWQMNVSSLPSPAFPFWHKKVTLNFITSIVIKRITFFNGTPCLSLLEIRFNASSPA